MLWHHLTYKSKDLIKNNSICKILPISDQALSINFDIYNFYFEAILLLLIIDIDKSLIKFGTFVSDEVAEAVWF